ncbi:hypothetical protein Hdeb2414_s0108g00796921 [Helianthus debilis subsp. tardiflorus]
MGVGLNINTAGLQGSGPTSVSWEGSGLKSGPNQPIPDPVMKQKEITKSSLSPINANGNIGNTRLDQKVGSINAAGPLDYMKELPPLCNSSPIKSSVKEPVLEVNEGSAVMAQKVYGSGFYDVSKNVFGSQSSPLCNTKNSFGKLRDEEECFDTDLGMWEHEIEMVKKFVETSTRSKIEEYSSWSENMRKYYDGLTKVNGDDAEVESETDEMARFMKIGSKF